MKKDLPTLFKEVKMLKKQIKADKLILSDTERFSKYSLDFLAKTEQRLQSNECELYVLKNKNLPLSINSFVQEISSIWDTNQENLEVKIEFSPKLNKLCSKQEFLNPNKFDNGLIFIDVVQRDLNDNVKHFVCLNAPLDLLLKQKNGIALIDLIDVSYNPQKHNTILKYNNYKNMIVHCPLCVLTDIYSQENNDLSKAVLRAIAKDLEKTEETEPNNE